MRLFRLLALAIDDLGLLRCHLRRALLRESFAISAHHTEIMLGVLIEILRRNAVARRLRLARQSQIALVHLIGVTPDFDVGAVAVEGLRPVRWARSAAATPVRIVMIRIAAAVA